MVQSVFDTIFLSYIAKPSYGEFQETNDNYQATLPHETYNYKLLSETTTKESPLKKYFTTTVAPPSVYTGTVENTKKYTYGVLHSNPPTTEIPNYTYGIFQSDTTNSKLINYNEQNPFLTTTTPPKIYTYQTQSTPEKYTPTTKTYQTQTPTTTLYTETTTKQPIKEYEYGNFNPVSTTVKPKKKLTFSFATASYAEDSTEKTFNG